MANKILKNLTTEFSQNSAIVVMTIYLNMLRRLPSQPELLGLVAVGADLLVVPGDRVHPPFSRDQWRFEFGERHLDVEKRQDYNV